MNSPQNYIISNHIYFMYVCIYCAYVVTIIIVIEVVTKSLQITKRQSQFTLSSYVCLLVGDAPYRLVLTLPFVVKPTKYFHQALPSVYAFQCLTGKVENNNNNLKTRCCVR